MPFRFRHPHHLRNYIILAFALFIWPFQQSYGQFLDRNHSRVPTFNAIESFDLRHGVDSDTILDDYNSFFRSDSNLTLSKAIQALIDDERFEDVLTLLSGAPQGLRQWEVYLLRATMLVNLERFKEAEKQTLTGINILTNTLEKTTYANQDALERAPFYYGILALRVRHCGVLMSVGEFDECKDELARIKSLYSQDFIAKSGFQSRIKQINDTLASVSFTYGGSPIIERSSNITGALNAFQKELYSKAGFANAAKAVHTPGWRLGVNMFASFPYSFSTREVLSVNLLLKTSIARGTTFSRLKGVSFFDYDSILSLVYQKPISSHAIFSQRLSIQRSGKSAGQRSGRSAGSLTHFSFSPSFRFILDPSTYVSLTPSIASQLEDNRSSGPSIFYGIGFEFKHYFDPFYGSPPSLSFNGQYQKFHFFDSSVNNNRHAFSLSSRVHLRPVEFFDIDVSLSPYFKIDIHESNIDKFPITNPRRDITLGVSTAFTFYAFPLVPGLQVYPKIEIVMEKVFSTAFVYNNQSLSGVIGIDFSF